MSCNVFSHFDTLQTVTHRQKNCHIYNTLENSMSLAR